MVDKNRETGMAVTITLKNGHMRFIGRDEDHSMKNKYISFFVDVSKKALAWRYFEQGDIQKLKHHKKITVTAKGVAVVSIKKELSAFGFTDNTKSFKRLEIKKYVPSGVLEDSYYYVILKQS